ncbi:MAG: hypothetical protein ABL903_19015 [Methylococcales bacterium]
MEEIIKAFGWPHFSFLFGLLFVLLFKSQLAELISRITSIGKEGVKASPTPEAQREKKKTEAVQELLLAIGDSIVLRDFEGRIKSDLIVRELEIEGDTVKILIKHLAAANVLLEFEQVHNLILGSQIYLLKKLNEIVGQRQNREKVFAHFEHVREMFKSDLGAWSFEQYMAFLIGRSLLTIDNETYHITNFDVEYLTWMARNGRSENRPL